MLLYFVGIDALSANILLNDEGKKRWPNFHKFFQSGSYGRSECEEDYMFTLGPHSFFWFGLLPDVSEDALPDRHPASGELPLFTYNRHWSELIAPKPSKQLTVYLLEYIRRQRWFSAKNTQHKGLTIREIFPLQNDAGTFYLLFIEIDYIDGVSETFTLSVAYCRSEAAGPILEKYPFALPNCFRSL